MASKNNGSDSVRNRTEIVSVRLTPRQLKKLDQIAQEEETRSEILRRGIQRILISRAGGER